MTTRSISPAALTTERAALLNDARSWPFEEARRLVKRVEQIPNSQDKTVLFETGYGPSGLPHIGTFGEVARTTMVRHAFETLTDGKIKTRLLCFSDDMDGMRKVPDNVPKPEMLREHLHKPLTRVPDPFEEFESFGHHNNAMLRRFLDTFGFDYEFASATEYYTSGRLDPILLRAAERYQAIMDIMLPTLGEERQATYSCFLPISPTTGRILYVPMKSVDAKRGEITFVDEDGTDVTLPVTGGRVKLQWKPDFGARWAALGVDFEMYGKDHMSNTVIYDGICKALGGTPPQHFVYELFLDENGEKISKSKGNGITIDEWLRYASPESLSLYMFQKPKSAKKLHFDVIPRAVDEYLQFIASYDKQEDKQKLDNPVWHIHNGAPPKPELPITFGLLLNLVSVSNAANKETLWGFVRRYSPGATPEANPMLDKLSEYAVRYFNDFVRPSKKYRAPDEIEIAALNELDATLSQLPQGADADTIQGALLDVARAIPRYQDTSKVGPNGGPGVKLDWFQAIYETLLGQQRGPRLGTFIALYGINETRSLISKAIAGTLQSEAA